MFVWQKITGGVIIIFLWPFVLRNCRVKYCPQDRKKRVVSVLHEEISAFMHCIHSLSNTLSLGDILPCFPSTVKVYRLGESADSVVCYTYVVVCSVYIWGTWGLFLTIQAALFYALWTCTHRKLFRNSSRRERWKRSFPLSNDIGEKGKKNKPSLNKNTTEDIQRPSPFFTFSVLEVKIHIHPKKVRWVTLVKVYMDVTEIQIQSTASCFT